MSFLGLTDEELMRRVAGSDEKAFELLYSRHSEKMLGYIYTKTHDKAVAEEIVHDCWVKLWTNRQTISISNNFAGYFFVMVKNQALQYLRSLDDITRFVDEIYAANVADNSCADTLIEYQSLEVSLERQVQQLPEKCRIVYQLSRDHSLSTREIAGQLDISPQTVKNQVSKALRLLKTGLQEARSFIPFF